MSRIEDVAAFMKQHQLVLVTAESCTAGLIAARLADIPGAGALLDCAFVTYSPEAKQRCLGLDLAILERHNLTSEAVAREMARGAAANSPAGVVIANTGVADATDDEIPSGTQCFAWAFKRAAGRLAMFTETRRFPGDRQAVRRAAAEHALLRVPFYYAQAGA